MDFSEVVAVRRSVRKLEETMIPDDALNRVLEAGRWAPSASNSQPWRFVVVTDSDVKKEISWVCTEFSRKAWAKFSPQGARYLAERGGSWDKAYMQKIPVLIAVCYKLLENMHEELVLASAWAAVENILLAATNEGLGSCIYTFYSKKEEDRLKKILRVPDDHRIAALIQLGYASTRTPLPSRKPLKEVVSYQHF